MHDVCCSLLIDIKQRFDLTVPDTLTPFIPDKDKIPWVVGFVFSTAAGKLDIDRSAMPTLDLLHDAAEVVQKRLNTGLGTVIKEGPKKKDDLTDEVEEALRINPYEGSSDRWNLERAIRRALR